MGDVFKQFNAFHIPCGNVGVQMGGWFRKEIKSADDLKGLRFRIGGIGGLILQKLGEKFAGQGEVAALLKTLR